MKLDRLSVQAHPPDGLRQPVVDHEWRDAVLLTLMYCDLSEASLDVRGDA